MGHYLSEPKTEKVSEFGVADQSSNLNLSYSAVSMQGWRRTMEDSLIVVKEERRGVSSGTFGTLIVRFDGLRPILWS